MRPSRRNESVKYIVNVCRKGFEETFTTDNLSETEICHKLMEEEYPSRLKIQTETVITASSAAAICTVIDILTGESLSRIGEAPLAASQKPVSEAFEEAYRLAVYGFLNLDVQPQPEVEEEPETRKEAEGECRDSTGPSDAGTSYVQEERPQEGQEGTGTLQASQKDIPSEGTLSDDTLLLIGGFRGRRFGDVKALPQFGHFLEQLKCASGKLTFQDEAKANQLVQLEQYAQAVCAGKGHTERQETRL